jgi:hypothetical protein
MKACKKQGEMRKNSTLAVLYFHKTSHLNEKSVLFLKKIKACMEGTFFLFKFMGDQKNRE